MFAEASPNHEHRVEYKQGTGNPNRRGQYMWNILVADHLSQGGDETTKFVPDFESLLEKKHHENAESVQAGAHGHMD